MINPEMNKLGEDLLEGDRAAALAEAAGKTSERLKDLRSRAQPFNLTRYPISTRLFL